MNNEIKAVREWLLQMSGGRFNRVECPDMYANIPVQAPVFVSASEGGTRVGDLFSFSGDSETIMVFPRPRGHLGGVLVIVRDDSAKTKWQVQHARLVASGVGFSEATTKMIQDHGYCPNAKLCVVMEG